MTGDRTMRLIRRIHVPAWPLRRRPHRERPPRAAAPTMAPGSLRVPRAAALVAIAVLVAVRVAPTNIAIMNWLPFRPTSPPGTRKNAMRNPNTSGSSTPPRATDTFFRV